MPLDIGKMCLRLPAGSEPASVIPTGLARAACRAIATKGRALDGGLPIIMTAEALIGLRPASPAVAAHPWSAQYVSPRLRDILALPDLSVEHVERRRRLQPMLHPVRVANIDPILSGGAVLRRQQAGRWIVVVGGKAALQQIAMGLLIFRAVREPLPFSSTINALSPGLARVARAPARTAAS